MRAATIMTMDDQQVDESKGKKDDITRLRKGIVLAIASEERHRFGGTKFLSSIYFTIKEKDRNEG